MIKSNTKIIQNKKNLLSSYHHDVRWSDFLWFELLEDEVLNEKKTTIEQPKEGSSEAESKIGTLQLKTEVVQSTEQVEAVSDKKINKTSEYFDGTKFATKIDSALKQLWSKETVAWFMDKIDTLFVNLMSREFWFLPDDVRNNLWSSLWTALLSWLYDGSSSEKSEDNKKENWPTKAEAIWWVFNSLTGINFNDLKNASWWFDLIKQVLSLIGWYDLLKNQITKISYMLDMIVILKKEDREKNMQFDRSESIINDPSKFVSILNSHDTPALLSIKNDEDKSKMIWLFFDQSQGVDMKDIWNKLWDIVDEKTAQAMVKGMEFAHATWTKLMNNRDINEQKFKWFYDMWKNVLSQVEWLAQAFGMGKEETSWLRSVLNWVFMIFTGKRFDSYEEDELKEKYKLDTNLKSSLDKARTDYLHLDPNTPTSLLGENILSLRWEDKQDMIRWVDKDKLMTSLTTNISSIDEKLVGDVLWDKKTWDVKQDIWLLLASDDFWKKITSDDQIAGFIKDGGWLVYTLWLLLTKGDTYLEGIKSSYIQIPYIKNQPTTTQENPITEVETVKEEIGSEQYKKDQNRGEDINTIKNKQINQLTQSERKLLFETVFWDGPATQFLTLIDGQYWWDGGNIYLNVLALAKHEWAQRWSNWRFGSDRVNWDTNWQTAMGTFQISAKWWREWVLKKYNDLVNKWIKYISSKGIWVNYDLSKHSNAQKDLLAFIAHTNWHIKKWWVEANWKELSSKLFDNTKDAAFMSQIQVGIAAIGKDVAAQIQNNKVDNYV